MGKLKVLLHSQYGNIIHIEVNLGLPTTPLPVLVILAL